MNQRGQPGILTALYLSSAIRVEIVYLSPCLSTHPLSNLGVSIWLTESHWKADAPTCTRLRKVGSQYLIMGSLCTELKLPACSMRNITHVLEYHCCTACYDVYRGSGERRTTSIESCRPLSSHASLDTTSTSPTRARVRDVDPAYRLCSTRKSDEGSAFVPQMTCLGTLMPTHLLPSSCRYGQIECHPSRTALLPNRSVRY